MPTMTLAELRAIVGLAGADLSDEQLLRLDIAADNFARSIVGVHLDRLDPAAAAVRRAQERAQLERDLAPRRRRYAREVAARQRKRAAAQRSA